MPTELEIAVVAHLEAALWSSIDDAGEPLDSSYDFDDVASQTRRDLANDVRGFIGQADGDGIPWREHLSAEQLGLDLWLTRNHHGAGFWDRGLPGELGTTLTRLAHAFGEVTLYVGDDGKIHA